MIVLLKIKSFIVFLAALLFAFAIVTGCDNMAGDDSQADAGDLHPSPDLLPPIEINTWQMQDREDNEKDSEAQEEAIAIISAPDVLPAGEKLTATVRVENVSDGIACAVTWYVDGQPRLWSAALTGEILPELTYEFTYSYDMPLVAEIKADIEYAADEGDIRVISAGQQVILENYDKWHWREEIAPEILRKVTAGYRGDYTLQWALDNDLEDIEKEIWVNAMGYTSRTGYLLWVSTAYQRTNIFRWSEVYERWELIRTCIVGTGTARNATLEGVTYITGKQEKWTFGAYIVRPVANFHSGSNYAFHSRLYYPDSDVLYDDSIGFPVSHGCVRMYDEDILFIYEEIPAYSTVVVH